MRIVTLVSCTAKKADSPCPAQDLYISPWFQKARRWAEGLSDEWYILSALHYLVKPTTLLAPYSYSLNDYLKDHPSLDTWANQVVFGLLYESGLWQARQKTGRYPYTTKNTAIVIMSGEGYRKSLVPRLEALGFVVYHPTPAMGIGEQLSYLGNTDPQTIKPTLQELLRKQKWKGWTPPPLPDDGPECINGELDFLKGVPHE